LGAAFFSPFFFAIGCDLAAAIKSSVSASLEESPKRSASLAIVVGMESWRERTSGGVRAFK
jgi:hypothetical protein